MMKLIASDLDGTILQNGAQSVAPSTLEAIAKLLEKGYMFVPASGRQLISLKKLFAPLSEKLIFIAENGALVEYQGKILAKNPLDKALALEIIEDVFSTPDCEVLVSGEKTAYIKPKSEQYYYRMTHIVNYAITVVEDFREIQEDILKVAVCNLSGIANSKQHFFERWSGKVSLTVSDRLYMDFMDKAVDKGNAMKQIQQRFDIAPEECMAFGDSFNDIGLLDAVTHSYAMEQAADEVKRHSRYVTDSVEKILREELL